MHTTTTNTVPVVFFDFETGGTTPSHPNTELAAAAITLTPWRPHTEVFGLHDLIQVHDVSHQRIVFDESDCDPEALTISRYDRELWRETAVPQSIAVSMLCDWAESYRSVQFKSKTNHTFEVTQLACFNQVFDMPRLKAAIRQADIQSPFSHTCFDALQLAMWTVGLPILNLDPLTSDPLPYQYQSLKVQAIQDLIGVRNPSIGDFDLYQSIKHLKQGKYYADITHHHPLFDCILTAAITAWMLRHYNQNNDRI